LGNIFYVTCGDEVERNIRKFGDGDFLGFMWIGFGRGLFLVKVFCSFSCFGSFYYKAGLTALSLASGTSNKRVREKLGMVACGLL